jgi:hypothetical protein
MMRNFLTIAFLILASATANAITVTKDGKQIEVPVCGGIAGLECGRGEWCDFPDNAVCGAVDVLGTCRPRPEVCIKVYMPVCGCNGETYGNACEAAAGGVDVAYLGECKARGK